MIIAVWNLVHPNELLDDYHNVCLIRHTEQKWQFCKFTELSHGEAGLTWNNLWRTETKKTKVVVNFLFVWWQLVQARQPEELYTWSHTFRTISSAMTNDTRSCPPTPSLVYRWCQTSPCRLDVGRLGSSKARVCFLLSCTSTSWHYAKCFPVLSVDIKKKLSWCWQTRATRLEASQGHQTWYQSKC